MLNNSHHTLNLKKLTVPVGVGALERSQLKHAAVVDDRAAHSGHLTCGWHDIGSRIQRDNLASHVGLGWRAFGKEVLVERIVCLER